MSNDSWFERLADLQGIKACLGYVARDLSERDLGFAAHLVGAAECEVEQEIIALTKRHRLTADQIRETEKQAASVGGGFRLDS